MSSWDAIADEVAEAAGGGFDRVACIADWKQARRKAARMQEYTAQHHYLGGTIAGMRVEDFHISVRVCDGLDAGVNPGVQALSLRPAVEMLCAALAGVAPRFLYKSLILYGESVLFLVGCKDGECTLRVWWLTLGYWLDVERFVARAARVGGDATVGLVEWAARARVERLLRGRDSLAWRAVMPVACADPEAVGSFAAFVLDMFPHERVWALGKDGLIGYQYRTRGAYLTALLQTRADGGGVEARCVETPVSGGDSELTKLFDTAGRVFGSEWGAGDVFMLVVGLSKRFDRERWPLPAWCVRYLRDNPDRAAQLGRAMVDFSYGGGYGITQQGPSDPWRWTLKVPHGDAFTVSISVGADWFEVIEGRWGFGCAASSSLLSRTLSLLDSM